MTAFARVGGQQLSRKSKFQVAEKMFGKRGLAKEIAAQYARTKIRALFLPPVAFKKHVRSEKAVQQILKGVESAVMKTEHGRNIGQWSRAFVEDTPAGRQMVAEGYVWAPSQLNPGRDAEKNLQEHERLVGRIKNGAYVPCSVGMKILDYKSGNSDTMLFEISLVEDPYFEGTSVTEIQASKTRSETTTIYGSMQVVETSSGTPPSHALMNAAATPSAMSVDQQPQQTSPPTADAAAAPVDQQQPAAANGADAGESAAACFETQYDANGNILTPTTRTEMEIDDAIGLTPDILKTMDKSVVDKLRANFKVRETSRMSERDQLLEHNRKLQSENAITHQEFMEKQKARITLIHDVMKQIGHDNENVLRNVSAIGNKRSQETQPIFNAIHAMSNAFQQTNTQYRALQESSAKEIADLQNQIRLMTASARNAGVSLPSAAMKHAGQYDPSAMQANKRMRTGGFVGGITGMPHEDSLVKEVSVQASATNGVTEILYSNYNNDARVRQMYPLVDTDSKITQELGKLLGL